MQPAEFEEQMIEMGKHQDEYISLPAWVDHERVISCWSMSFRERLKVLFTGRIWVHVLNFKQNLQPQYLSVDSPFTTEE